MGEATYPTADDLAARVRSLGVLNPATQEDVIAGLRLDVKAAGAAAEWELRTGWRPFLADAADVTETIDPPGMRTFMNSRAGARILELPFGLVAFTSLLAAYTTENPGTPLVLNRDFYLLEKDAPGRGQCWRAIEFRALEFGPPRSLQITGRRGYATSIPSDVWDAIVDYGLLLCQPVLSLNVSRGLSAAQDMHTKLDYAKPLSAERAAWENSWRDKVLEYLRIWL